MYNYIFYKLYKIAKKTEKNLQPHMRMPVTISLFTISTLQFYNLMTLYVLLVYGFELIKPIELTKELAIFTGLLLYTLNYFFFLRKKKVFIIEEKFDKESKELKLIKTILFWLYIIGSFVLFYFILEKFKTVNR